VSGPSANDLYKAARSLARDGQPVFPCRPVGRKAKAPLTRNGLHDASTDPAVIKDWWRRRGDAAIGIPTGIVWDVLDVDTKGEVDGRMHLANLNRLGLLDGCKKVVTTPSGGFHLYFKAAPEGALTNKASATLGLDVRSRGGYVLAPPSWIDDEEDSVGSYEHAGETTGSTDDPLLWDLIVSALAPVDIDTRKPMELLPSERRASLAALREWVANLAHGERNNGLHWAVCRCIESGLDPHELVEPALLAGLGEDEVLLTINSAMRRAGVTVRDLKSEAEALFG
jgi:hypothetical protein